MAEGDAPGEGEGVAGDLFVAGETGTEGGGDVGPDFRGVEAGGFAFPGRGGGDFGVLADGPAPSIGGMIGAGVGAVGFSGGGEGFPWRNFGRFGSARPGSPFDFRSRSLIGLPKWDVSLRRTGVRPQGGRQPSFYPSREPRVRLLSTPDG